MLPFWLGVLGGFLAELVALWKIRHKKLPAYLSSGFYWITTVLMILSGGALCLVYTISGMTLSPIVAVNVGASAPLIIGSLAAHPPRINR